MQAVTLGLANFSDLSGNMAAASNSGGQLAMDPAQLQHLMQLLSGKAPPQVLVPPPPAGATYPGSAAAAAAAAAAPKQTAVVECPKSMVGRVIGKGGETIKALQQYTGAMIQIDQSTDPTRVTVAGSAQSLQLAVSMVGDIVRGTFKGFAMLRQIAMNAAMGPFGQPQPVYVQGYGFVPPSQVFAPEDPAAAAAAVAAGLVPPPAMMRSPPNGPLTPPMTPLRPPATGDPLLGTLTPEALASLMAVHQGGMQAPRQAQMAPSAASSQDALISHLLSQLAVQQAPTPSMQQQQVQQQQQQQMEAAGLPPRMGQAGLDQGAIQTILAQAGLMGAGQAAAAANAAPGIAQLLSPTTAAPMATNLMLSAQGTPAVLGNAGQPVFQPSAGQQQLVSSAPPSAGSVSPPHSGPPSFLGSPPPSLGGTTSPAAGITSLTAAAQPSLAARRPGSGESSPLGRYGAIGSSVARGGSIEGGTSPRPESPVFGGALTGPSLWTD